MARGLSVPRPHAAGETDAGKGGGGGVRTAEDFAASLTDKALHCRELGHVWRPLTVSFDERARAYDRSLRCSSCRTIRIQVLDSRGHVLTNRYKYPDGYLAKDVDRVGSSRDAYRVEAVVRFLSAHTTTAPKARLKSVG